MDRPRGIRAWLADHKQRLAYVLVAVSMVVVLGTATAGGFLLHHAAGIQRQSLRTQQLGSAAFRLQNFLSRAQSEKGVSKRLAAERSRALEAAAAAFRLVQAHDRAGGDRIRASYVAYLRSSRRAFDRAAAANGRVLAAEQRRVEDRLARLEFGIDAEIERQARATRETNPQARLTLVVAALAAALLVGLLIWQFEMQRRAGRIDRDNAERSEELIRLRDEFVATVSHELRTPLTSILGYLELITKSESGERRPDHEAYLAVVQRNADRLLRLVTDLLLVAEARERAFTLHIHEVDLGTLAARCVEAARPAADAKQIRLALSSESPSRLEGDSMRLAQMMDNLISNAIKFTPAGECVTVRTAARDGQAVFEVTDSGNGISVADKARLFERFFRARTATTQAIQGTGLGLTITKMIVDAHRGSIEVESAIGSGTTFRVQLPLYVDDRNTTADAEPRTPSRRKRLPHQGFAGTRRGPSWRPKRSI
jgi:signal transduction histidine kinase